MRIQKTNFKLVTDIKIKYIHMGVRNGVQKLPLHPPNLF